MITIFSKQLLERGTVAKKKNKHTNDPLTPKQANALLRSVSVIRDPVHGDIRLTNLERTLVDTPEFQRLRNIRQLAMVDYVYPGAVHNRFLHSLGTLHTCSEMILACNNATKMYSPSNAPVDDPIPVKIGYYAELLARLTALLHDLAHVPFGHVFEKDAQVFAFDEWQDPWRMEKLFGKDSNITKEIRTFFQTFFSVSNDEEIYLNEKDALLKADELIKDICEVLKADSTDYIVNIRYPFVHDLVGNTICADLIDYVQRDMYYSGLTEGLGKRFLQYISILPVKFEIKHEQDGKRGPLQPYRVSNGNLIAAPSSIDNNIAYICRVVMLQYRYNKQHAPVAKHNILAEAIDLVRRRKTVAEKLYFHKTKLIATSMLSTAAYASGFTSAQELWDKSDYEVLKEISNTVVEDPKDSKRSDDDHLSNEERLQLRASTLAKSLLNRKLLKPIYRISYHAPCGDDHSRLLWHEETGAYARYDTPSKRHPLITKLEDIIGSFCGDVRRAIGSVSISCPQKDMQLKEFDMLVLFRPDDTEIRRLEDIDRPIVKSEIEVIQKGHQELWCLEVYVDPELVPLNSDFAKTLSTAIQSEIGLTNELVEFACETEIGLDNLINKTLLDSIVSEHELRDKMNVDQYEELLSASYRDDMADHRKAIIEKLESMGLLK